MVDPAPGEHGERLRPAESAAPLDLPLGEARQRFAITFADACDGLSRPADDAAADPAALVEAVTVLHRLAGEAGTAGCRRVAAEAAELEEALTTGALNRGALGARVPRLREAFTLDVDEPLAGTPWAERAATPMTVLLVEDEPVQRAILLAQLRALGHVAVAVATGEEAVEAARKERPDAILLDVELPGIDGYAVCQLLKADPYLAAIPVAFLSAHGTVDDRLTGLSVGADDFMTKPIERRELALRLMHLERLRHNAGAAEGGVLTYEMFRRDASDLLRRDRSVLALIRTPAHQTFDVAVSVCDELRRRDLCGRYDRNHVVVLLPDLGRAAARDRIAAIVESCRARGAEGVYAGLAAAEAGDARTLEQLLEEADEALAIARYENVAAAVCPDEPRDAAPGAVTEPLVLVADDDPDVVRIVDAHLATAGYRRILAFDGSEALQQIRATLPDIVVLDLMMPRLTGFDVLAGLRDMGDRRPRIIVLSARGREDSVMRAFSLGVDDFMLKPFNPQELLARIARLLRGSGQPPRRSSATTAVETRVASPP